MPGPMMRGAQLWSVAMLLGLDRAMGQCTNACSYPTDGECDDGGPGAEYTACALGTDCGDCSSRLRPPPMTPPVAPLAVGGLIILVKFVTIRIDFNTTFASWDARLTQASIDGASNLFRCDGMVDPSKPRCTVVMPAAAATLSSGTKTRLELELYWDDATEASLCPPVAPSEPPQSPSMPPPPPPPSPYDTELKVAFADGMQLYDRRKAAVPPPSPPRLPGCQQQVVLASASDTYGALRMAEVQAMTISNVESAMSLATNGLTIDAITLDSGETTRGVVMPPSSPNPPPEPGAPPPPPSPPLPPLPPPALCTNECNDRGRGRVGVCDDGALASELDASIADRATIRCELGTDCADCSPRSHCHSCPAACQALAADLAHPGRSCLELMFSSGVCWPQCNTAECGHKSCTTESAIEACLASDAREGRTFSTTPAAIPDVQSTFEFGQLNLAVDDSGTGVKLDFALTYALSWSDSRLAFSACRDVLATLLSARHGVELELAKLYWRPALSVSTPSEPAKREALISSGFTHRHDQSMPSSGNATLVVRKAVTLRQEFLYRNFPFDHHTLEIDLEIDGANLEGCDALIATLRAAETQPTLSSSTSARLLPDTQTWLWRRCGTSGGRCSAADAELDIHLDEATRTADLCPVRLEVRRNNAIFVVQHLLPITIIAEAPLLALWLNPSNPTLISARCSLHIFAMVLVMLKQQVPVCLLFELVIVYLPTFDSNPLPAPQRWSTIRKISVSVFSRAPSGPMSLL